MLERRTIRRVMVGLLGAAVTIAVVTGGIKACRHHGAIESKLFHIDQLLETDSIQKAISLIEEIEDQTQSLSTALQMHYQLVKAKAMNKAWINFTSDSIMKFVVAYYDRNGSHNERLLAHYLLGCVYRDLKEAPQAIGCYHDAIDCADTLSRNCDLKTLSCVYSQMATIYYNQLALDNARENFYKSLYYSLRIQDTLNALYDFTQISTVYILQNKSDSAKAILLKAKDLYLIHGYRKEWVINSLPLAHLYLIPPMQLDSTKAILDCYKSESGLFIEKGSIPPMYYNYRARYHEAIGNLDSAEIYYRKMYYPGMEPSHMDPMYCGLLNIYRHKGDVDSIVKYTLLYCQANDSSIAIKDRELIAQMNASYNYSRLQNEASKQKTKAATTLNWMIFFIALAIILLFTSISVYVFYRKRRRQKQKELEQAKHELMEANDKYTKEMHGLHLLENTHKKVIELIQQELESSQANTEMYRSKYEEAQHRIKEINSLYEKSKNMHNEEMMRVRSKIEELQQITGIGESLIVAKQFQETVIVKKILYQAGKSKYELSKAEWETLVLEFGQSYPTLLSALHQAPTIKDKGVKVCILVTIQLRESDIAHFLNISDTAISNYKSDINLALFNDRSARTLFKNLEKKYGLFY